MIKHEIHSLTRANPETIRRETRDEFFCTIWISQEQHARDDTRPTELFGKLAIYAAHPTEIPQLSCYLFAAHWWCIYILHLRFFVLSITCYSARPNVVCDYYTNCCCLSRIGVIRLKQDCTFVGTRHSCRCREMHVAQSWHTHKINWSSR